MGELNKPRRAWLPGLAFACGACTQPPPTGLCDGAYCPSQRSVQYRFQESRSREVDLLFLVDDTAAMGEARGRFVASLPRMASVLENLPEGPLSLHVAFASASNCGGEVGARGPACGLSAPTGFLVSEWCNQVTNYSGSMTEVFRCLGDFSPQTCGPAQPLERLRALLADRENGPAPLRDFLRPEAYLQIVIVAGEDDASGGSGTLTPVSELVSFIRGLKADPAAQIFMSVIAPGECPMSAATAPPPRFAELLAAFGDNALFHPLCLEDFAPALRLVAERLPVLIGLRCLQGVADLDPMREGLQPACVVAETLANRDGTADARILPSCEESGPPCWSLTGGGSATASFCPVGTAYFEVQRETSFCREAADTTELECLSPYRPPDR